MLDERIKSHLDKVLEQYTTGDFYDKLLEAKKYYFEITGTTHEEDEDFENRMNAFNDWYIFQFVSKDSTRTPVKDYISKNQVEEEVSESLTSVRHSFFIYTGKNFRKHMVLKDVLYGDKIVLPKDHNELGILKDDAFTGRVINYGDSSYLLDGICVVPKQAIPIIKKEAKKVKRLNDEYEESQFLYKIEFLKNKWLRYGHLDPEKIFYFRD